MLPLTVSADDGKRSEVLEEARTKWPFFVALSVSDYRVGGLGEGRVSYCVGLWAGG